MRCILPDLPGHGQSRNVELNTLAQAADTVAALIVGRFDSTPVNLVGLSFGSYVGLMLMARHPRLIRRGMLSGIQLGAIPNPWLMYVMSGLISPLILLPWFRRKSAEALGVTDPRVYNRADGSAILSPRTLRSVLRLASVFDVYELLPNINVPTLMIAGEREHSTILTSLSDYQRLMPNCTARTVPTLGHAWCNQDPDLFADTLRAWARDAPLPDLLRKVDP